jgi:hypothetical protein
MGGRYGLKNIHGCKLPTPLIHKLHKKGVISIKDIKSQFDGFVTPLFSKMK